VSKGKAYSRNINSTEKSEDVVGSLWYIRRNNNSIKQLSQHTSIQCVSALFSTYPCIYHC